MESANQCQICKQADSKYVCPKCNIPYCSLKCYQSELHSQCSETFYKDCVVEQIRSEDVDPQTQSKMMEILQRVQNIDEQFDEEVPDSDDDDSVEDLAGRLAGVDLDDPDSVWEKLTLAEKQQFEELLRSGDVSQIVPHWQPWWLFKEEKKLVTDLDTVNQAPELPSNIPKLLENIQPLSKLSKVSPSPCVRWNVVNILAAYSLTARIFNGDYLDSPQEAGTTIVSLSKNLSSNQVFEDPENAVAAVHLAAVSNSCVLTNVDEGQLKEDVRQIVEGPSESKKSLYVLAALSETHQLFSACKKKVKESKNSPSSSDFYKRFPDARNSTQQKISVSEINKHLKKIDFYLSWAVEYY
ncbi:zinc finger HIT domain-containing protein 2 [Macrosteles quadrilineatus]|uniref:zinc finger HIT domain-containing protein 2 n=1 Tax=Macrosteles quadrilineatus TaxID=74068 RepID=UPI0023E27C79|nr:zinc finger HIT domain-containing protein 2 [Macrosteles quadrilineatus]